MLELWDVHLHHLHVSWQDLLQEVRRGESGSSGPAQRLKHELARRFPYATESRMKRISRPYFIALVVCLPFVASAQEKQRFSSIDEAMQASAILRGRQGPQNVNWIEGQSARLIRQVTFAHLERYLKSSIPPALAPAR